MARGQALTLAGNAAVADRPERAALSVIIPTLNEERNIGALIRSVRREIETIGISHELLVIDGGSADRTIDEVEQAGARWIRQQGAGFGSAVREGMARASGEWVLLMDADWSHPPAAISDLWLARSGADLVIGSRTVGGSSSDAPLYRQALTWVLHFLFAAAFRTGVRDVSSGFRLYRRSALTPDLYSAVFSSANFKAPIF